MSDTSNGATNVAEALSGSKIAAIARIFRGYEVILILMVALLVVTAFLAPVFFAPGNLVNVARQASITGVVAIGMTFVILTSGIDLSVGSILALVGIVFAVAINAEAGVAAALALAALCGVGVGLVNGFGVTFLGIQPFVMTLSSMAIFSGVALLISNGTPIPYQSESWLIALLGNGNLGGVPGPVIMFVLVAAAAGFVLRFTPFGRFVYGIGGGVEAARLSGVRTARVLLMVYATSGFCAAMAGVITTSRLFVGHPTAGSFIMLDSIAAVVIGGTSLMGGKGGVVGTIAGVFLLAMVANLLNLLGVSPFNQQIAKGAIIILAIVFTAQGLKARIAQQWQSL